MPSARLHAGHAVAALGALLTVTALWMPWYAPASSEPAGAFARGMLEAFGRSTTLDAWTVFGGTDALLAGAGALVLVAAVAAAGDRVDTEAAARGIAAVGAVALVLVVLKLVDQPGPDALLDVRHGGWVAAGGSALMLAGGLAARSPLDRMACRLSRRARPGAV
jgi:hypothetical protein